MTRYSKDRETKETKLSVEIDDEKDFKESEIDTGIGFFDHMLTLFSFHSELYVNIKAEVIYTLTVTTLLKISV